MAAAIGVKYQGVGDAGPPSGRPSDMIRVPAASGILRFMESFTTAVFSISDSIIGAKAFSRALIG